VPRFEPTTLRLRIRNANDWNAIFGHHCVPGENKEKEIQVESERDAKACSRKSVDGTSFTTLKIQQV
jgi:hypothetical protein